ncbi:Peptidase M13 domain containing protein [Aphelenchoides fujianensis]|nr:Peptidase M13 domain containing protein [Aphelenchoides fujianensis]
MLFDFYDSCTAEEHQDQLGTQPFAAFVFRLQGTQPFAAFVSRLGGWSLLQNAKFDGANFAWESLEQQLAGYDLPALLSITIEAPAFLLATYRRQLLDDYFTRLLEELEVDAALAQEAVQEALDFESALIGTTPDVAAESEKMRLSELKERYNKIDWTRVFGQSADERKEADVQVQVDVAHLDRLLMQLDKGKSPIGNYMMLRTLHSLVAHLPRRFRAHHERLDERYEPRWRTCVREMGELLAAPLYAFSFQQLESLDYSKLSGTISRSKEQVAKQLRQSQWLDGETQQRLLQNVHNLRVITNLLNGPQAAEQVRAAFEGARLDRSSYFDNVLLLKQTNSRASGRGILGAYDWHALLTNPSPVVNAENKEMIYGPVSIRALTQAPQLVQTMIVRRHLLEYLFNPAAVSGWKAESRSILNAKFNCFERGLAIRPHQQIYDQMALQAADERGADDDLRLPGLTEFNSQQLLFIAFGASACNNDQSTKSASEKSINHILQNLDGFAEAFDCPIGTPMNPRDKCSVL